MKGLYRKTKRGVAFVLSFMVVFIGVFAGYPLGVKAEGNPKLTVSADFSVTSGGTVYYIPMNGNGDEPDTWVQITGGISDPVDARAVAFLPAVGFYASSIVFTEERFDPHDGSIIWLPDGETRNLVSVSFTEGEPPVPEPCQLTVESYNNTYGKIYYTADLDGNDNWVEVDSEGIDSAVAAFRVKGIPADGYMASYKLNGQNITDYGSDGDHGLMPECGVNTVTDISFTESDGGSGGGGNPAIHIIADGYDTSHGKLQYSVNETDWVDIPTEGIDIDGAFVKAVPNEGYSVSYKIDGNEIKDTNSHGLSSNPALHYINDIRFTSQNKSLVVSEYDATGGTIKYSTDGTTWSDVEAAGGTVQARYVKAVAKNGYAFNSFSLNSQTVYSLDPQTLTADNNTLSDVSFTANASGGRYLLSVDKMANIQSDATVTFLNSEGGVVGTAETGSVAAVPDGTAKIRITVTDKRFLKSIQIFRNTAPAEPGSQGAVEIARPNVEEGLWKDGTVEFTASSSYSYKFVIELSNTKNVGWSYRQADKDTDLYVENCKLYLLDANGEKRGLYDEVANVETTDYASYNLTIGQTYKFELVPDYGYQVAGLSINGYTVEPTNDMGIFSFTMSNTNFHFKGVVKPANDIVDAPSHRGATISGGSNAAKSGNVKMTITDKETDNSAAAVAGEGATAVATLDIDLDKIISKGDGQYAGQYWSENLTTTSGDVTISIPVSADGLEEGETFSVVRDHLGVKTELNATYNSTTGMLTFGSNQFSDYTIVKKGGTPSKTPEPVVKQEENSGSDSDSSSNNNDDDGDTPPAKTELPLGVVINENSANGSNSDGTTIKDWSDLNELLLKDNGNAGSKGKSGRQKSKKELVQIVLNKKSATVPTSTFESLYKNKSNKSGLHVFVGNGVAVTFINDQNLTKQKSVDLTCEVTTSKNSKIISFKKYAVLKANTALHTTLPKGVKSAMLYRYDVNGKKIFVGWVQADNNGRVCIKINELTKYELVY